MTKSQVNKVGKNIRRCLKNGDSISEADLNSLQDYRTSFQADIASIFEQISSTSKSERSDSIVAFRIKRIESILSKIKRQPTMALGNMGDIAGCRVLVYSDVALHNLVKKFNALFNVKYHNNYLQESKEDGYRGYHLYVESPINENKLIEIQLRTVSSHKWASLVEIIDIIYDKKMKEGQKHPDFEKFLFLLSGKENLTIEDKLKIIEIDEKYSIYNKLNEVFIKNHIQIRQDWIKLGNANNNYFIIEVDSDKKTNILSFDTYIESESKYFEMFGSNSRSNFVLTHIEKPNFKRVCIAYASYMLVNHNYLDDWSKFIFDIIGSENKIKSKSNMDYYSEYIRRNLTDQLELLNTEIGEVEKFQELDQYNDKLAEWIGEIKDTLKKVNEIANQQGEVKKEKSKSLFGRLFR